MTHAAFVDLAIKITEPGQVLTAAGFQNMLYENRGYGNKYRSFRYMPNVNRLGSLLVKSPYFEYTGDMKRNVKLIRRI